MQVLKFLPLFFLSSLFAACNSGSDTSQTNGTAAGNTAAASPSDKKELTFMLADQTVSKGDTVYIEVTVRDFTNILSMQYSFNWNPNVLKFIKLDKLNLKDLTINNFGLNRTEQGKIGTSWFDLAVKGISLPDGTPIYRVCFLAVGDPGSKDQVFFSSEPVVIEISNSAEQLLNLAFKRATITIQ
ncbi:MAG: hypothetical protein H6563_07005 [Lewinellaceae bacterium]|nr:hypothetical protein [Lewinellaceae bacterium]